MGGRASESGWRKFGRRRALASILKCAWHLVLGILSSSNPGGEAAPKGLCTRTKDARNEPANRLALGKIDSHHLVFQAPVLGVTGAPSALVATGVAWPAPFSTDLSLRQDSSAVECDFLCHSSGAAFRRRRAVEDRCDKDRQRSPSAGYGSSERRSRAALASEGLGYFEANAAAQLAGPPPTHGGEYPRQFCQR
jgi:hypothetical protein